MQVNSLISNISSDFSYFYPSGHWTCSVVCHFNCMESIQSCSHFGTLNLSYTLPSLSYQVLIFTWVKWSIWRWSALPKDTTSRQCPNIEKGETWNFLEKSCTKRDSNRTAGSDIGRAPRSNHCAMSVSERVNSMASLSYTNPATSVIRNMKPSRYGVSFRHMAYFEWK